MRIAVIILNWNGIVQTVNCLQSFADVVRNSLDIRLIVVDNASIDGSVKKIKSLFPEVILIENKDNFGFAGGNNIGIRYALKMGVDFVFVLNNDTFIKKDTLKELLKTQFCFKAQILSPKIYFSKGSEFHKDRYKPSELGKVIWYAGGSIDWQNVRGFHIGVDEVDYGQFIKEREVDYATGAAMLVKREVFEKIGLFDERYYLYYEDLDFCWRAKRKGFKIMFSPKAIIWHNNAASSASGSALQDYYITRNRLLFGIQYAPYKSKLVLLKEALGILLSGRKWQKRGILDFILRRFGRGSYE